jgi:hypothetical protein
MNNFLSLQELISDYAAAREKILIWFDAKGIRKLEDAGNVDKLNQVYTFYREFLPDDVYEEFFHSSFGTFERQDSIAAQDVAEDWFPPVETLPDSDYYVYCCVFNRRGVIEYENITPTRQGDTD